MSFKIEIRRIYIIPVLLCWAALISSMLIVSIPETVAASDNFQNQSIDSSSLSRQAQNAFFSSPVLFTSIATRDYYWTWYDDFYMKNWLLIANPEGSGGPVSFEVAVDNQKKDLSSFALQSATCTGGICPEGTIPEGMTLAARFNGLVGGPVKATSLTGGKAIVSQRSLLGDSFEEVLGSEASNLSSRFVWTWYDQQSSGYINWVLVANPGDSPIYYEITLAGEDPGEGSRGTIEAGGRVTPTFPGKMGGPLEVTAWTDDMKSVEATVMASQRVTSNFGKAFNEVPGIPYSELSDSYFWTWYDQQSSGSRDWVLVANPNAQDIYYEITIGGEAPNSGSSGIIGPGQNVTPTFAGLIGGPVRVRTWLAEIDNSGNQKKLTPMTSIASQRVAWGPSFEEVPGYATNRMAPEYFWTWYDQQSLASTNWVLVANPNSTPVYYEITVAGALPGLNASGTIDPGKNVTPTFPGVMAGPVSVRAWTDETKAIPASVISSQRVIWNGYFNEVLGTVRSEPSISVDAGRYSIDVPLGTTSNIGYVIDYKNDDENIYHIDFSQTIAPDVSGISLVTDPDQTTWASNDNQTWLVNEKVTGNSLGTYELTSKTTIAETGKTQEVKVIVNVIDNAQHPVLNPLGSNPDAIPLTSQVNVNFTTLLSNTLQKPSSMVLEELDDSGQLIKTWGNFNDDGNSGDSLAGDFSYGAAFGIQSNVEGHLNFRVKAIFSGAVLPVYSEVYELPVTHFPIDIQKLEMSKISMDTLTASQIVSDEVIVQFKEGTAPGTIESIIASVNGNVIGSIQSLGIYQVRSNPDGVTAVHNTINLLIANPNVLSAQPNFIAVPEEVTPNDPNYVGQWGLTKIRADEAWVTSRGSNVLLGIVDTGIDYNHSDLSGKVTLGYDFANNDSNPWDDNGHGTHVAGIAAALSNNSIGGAGVAWNSGLLAVKVLGQNGSGSNLALAKGIVFAVNSGARVINVSLGSTANDKSVEDAVNYAHSSNRLVVAAAGNNNCSSGFFPAAFPSVLSVGATTPTDERSIWIPGQPTCTQNSGSNFGNWVDIAAPGSGISSTFPGNNYVSWNGTSMATPFVTGAAALVWSQNPSWSADQVRSRLEATAKPLPNAQLGAGRLDVFEAVMNGSFESKDLSDWSYSGTASVFDALGPLVPQERNGHKKSMGYLSTGPSNDYVSSELSKTFTIQSGLSSIPISFDYNFVTEEYPEWVNTEFNDYLTITIQTPSGNLVTLASETVNGSTFYPVTGIDFPGGDNTVGMTGWKAVTVQVPVTEGAGKYRVYVSDAGDDIFDSVILLDNIRFKQ